MSIMSKYYEMKENVEKLKEELKKLEENDELKKELDFKKDLMAVIKKHKRTLDDAFTALVTENPSYAKSNKRPSTKSGKPRPLQVYKNPHTGEVVKTRGANHKKLNEWRAEYGAGEVRSWLQD